MAGETDAFAELVRRWERPIQRLGARMTGDAHRGQDLAQEAFARLYASRGKYASSGRFSSFLWRIALNVCYDELRRMKRRGESSFDEVVGLEEADCNESGPDELADRQERAESVRCAVLQLAEPYRAVVVLRHFEGLKFSEISEVLGVPEGTVKSRMAEALSRLSKALRPVLGESERLLI